MSDENQIEIPPSFTALFADRSGTRLRTPISEVRQRYEACEDLATHLTETARILAHVEVPSEDEVLHRIHAGLRSDGSGVSQAEARWVVLRLAEQPGRDPLKRRRDVLQADAVQAVVDGYLPQL